MDLEPDPAAKMFHFRVGSEQCIGHGGRYLRFVREKQRDISKYRQHVRGTIQP